MHKDNKAVYDFVTICDMKKFKSGAIIFFLNFRSGGMHFVQIFPFPSMRVAIERHQKISPLEI